MIMYKDILSNDISTPPPIEIQIMISLWIWEEGGGGIRELKKKWSVADKICGPLEGSVRRQHI